MRDLDSYVEVGDALACGIGVVGDEPDISCGTGGSAEIGCWNIPPFSDTDGGGLVAVDGLRVSILCGRLMVS